MRWLRRGKPTPPPDVDGERAAYVEAEAYRIVDCAAREFSALCDALAVIGDAAPVLPDELGPVCLAVDCQPCLVARADGRVGDVCGRCAPVLVG